MLRFLALLSLVAVCGCGNSNRVGSYHETSTTLGVSEPYTLPGAKTRCVGSSCGYMPPSSAQRADLVPLHTPSRAAVSAPAGEFVDPDAFASQHVEPATVVELPPERSNADSSETVVPVSTSTTTTLTAVHTDGSTTTSKRAIRWPRKLQ